MTAHADAGRRRQAYQLPWAIQAFEDTGGLRTNCHQLPVTMLADSKEQVGTDQGHPGDVVNAYRQRELDEQQVRVGKSAGSCR